MACCFRTQMWRSAQNISGLTLQAAVPIGEQHLHSVTLRYAAPLYVKALLDRKWPIGRGALNGANRYI